MAPWQDGANGHQGKMQTGQSDGREGAVVDSHDAIVEGAEPQPVGYSVVKGAEYRLQCQGFAHLVASCYKDPVSGSNDGATGNSSNVVDIMPFEQDERLAASVNMANATVEGCPQTAVAITAYFIEDHGAAKKTGEIVALGEYVCHRAVAVDMAFVVVGD